jgi:hypothetical protein
MADIDPDWAAQFPQTILAAFGRVRHALPLQRDRLWLAGHVPCLILVWWSEGPIWN